MKKMMQLAIRLYPAYWRTRYAAEMEALLEDLRPSLRSLIDLTLGALKTQLLSWSFLKTAMVSTLAGALLASAAGLTFPRMYISQALLSISAGTDVPGLAERALTDRALVTLANLPALYPQT